MEKKNLLKVDRAPNGARDYREDQLPYLRAYAALRVGGMGPSEANAVASELSGGSQKVDATRLALLAERSFVELETTLQKTLVLWRLVRSR